MAEEFTTNSDKQQIEDLLSRLLGPEVSNMLADSVTKGLSGFTNNNMTLPGGASMLMGPGGLFAGPRAIEQNAAQTLLTGALTTNMTEAAKVAETLRLNIRDGASQSLFGVDAPTSSFSGLNMASDFFLYGSLGIKDFTNNFKTAGRYMGVTSPFVSGDTAYSTRAAENFSGISAFLTADLGYNPGSYAGLSAGEVGTLAADLSRTGAFSGMDLGSVSAGDAASLAQGQGGGDITASGQAQLQNMRTQIQAVSGMVSEFKRVFNTDVTGAMDKINSLFSVDVAQTFSPARLQELSRALPSTAMATGFTSAQVMGFGAASQAAAASGGFTEFTGGMQTGMLSAQMFRAAAQTGENPFAFVNENSFRNTLVSRTTGAALSGLALDVSGGAALVQRMGGNVDAYYAELNGMDGQFSVGDIAAAAQSAGAAGVNADDLRSASYSQEARRFAESGRGTGAVLGNNAGFITDIRKETAKRIMRLNGMSSAQAEAAIGSIDGALTSSALRDVLGGRQDIADDIDRAFTQNSRGNGFSSLEAEDLFLGTLHKNGRLDAIIAETKNLGNVQEFIGGATSAVGGFQAFAKLAAGFQGGERASVNGLISAALGVKDFDGAGLFGGDSSVFNVADPTDDRAVALRKLAVGAATSAVFSGKMGDRSATAEEQELAKKLFSAKTPEERDSILAELEQKVMSDPSLSSERFELNAATASQNLKYDIMNERGDLDDYTLTGTEAAAARDLAFIDQFSGIKDLKTLKGKRGEADSDEGKFRSELDKLRANIRNAAVAGESYSLNEDERGIMEQARKEARLNDDIGGVSSSGGMGSLLEIAKDILQALLDSSISGNKKGGP